VRKFEARSVFHLVSLQHIKVKRCAVYFLVVLLASLQSCLAEDLSRARCVYFYAAPRLLTLAKLTAFANSDCTLENRAACSVIKRLCWNASLTTLCVAAVLGGFWLSLVDKKAKETRNATGTILLLLWRNPQRKNCLWHTPRWKIDSKRGPKHPNTKKGVLGYEMTPMAHLAEEPTPPRGARAPA